MWRGFGVYSLQFWDRPKKKNVPTPGLERKWAAHLFMVTSFWIYTDRKSFFFFASYVWVKMWVRKARQERREIAILWKEYEGKNCLFSAVCSDIGKVSQKTGGRGCPWVYRQHPQLVISTMKSALACLFIPPFCACFFLYTPDHSRYEIQKSYLCKCKLDKVYTRRAFICNLRASRTLTC